MSQRDPHGKTSMSMPWTGPSTLVGPPVSRNADTIGDGRAGESAYHRECRVGQRKRWTVDEFLAARDAAPPGVRYELVDGERLVTPSPAGRHQRAVRLLVMALDPYVRRLQLGEVVLSPKDVQAEPESITQPECRCGERRSVSRGSSAARAPN